jgi:N-acetylglucosamine-6-phosphate deacetylase
MATQVPAESIGVGDQVGTIEAGRVADFIVIDENLDLQATYMAGQAVYER